MPTSIIHLEIGLIFVLLFLGGTIFPDIDKVIQKKFWKENCWKGFYKPIYHTSKTCILGRNLAHDWHIWMGILMFSLGCLVHILSDITIKVI